MKKLFYLISLLLMSSALYGQKKDIESGVIEAIGTLRNLVFTESRLSRAQLDSLQSRWYDLEKDSSLVNYLIQNISYSKKVYNSSLKRIMKFCTKKNIASPILDNISDSDLEILKQNFELIILINNEYIRKEKPHIINIDTLKLQEFDFLNIQDGEIIADIGSGVSNHIFITTLLYPNNRFILNEIDPFIKKYLLEKIDLFGGRVNDYDRITVVKGKEKNINLGMKADRIIIRNAFHHFSKKAEMLKSIKKSLNPNGTIILIEPLISNTTSIDECQLKMDYTDVMTFINQANLEVILEKQFDETLFLSCKTKKK